MTTLDLSLGGWPGWADGGASVVGQANGGYNNEYWVKCSPPTSGGSHSGIGQLSITNQTCEYWYMSWLLQVGSTWSANNEFDAVKHLILQAGPDPTRPMIYLDCRPGHLGIAPTDSAFICPAQGTTRYYSESFPGSSAWDGNNRMDFYFGQSNTTAGGKPVLAPSTWVCMELLCDSRAPTGLIRMRASKSDGTILSDLDANMGWQYEAGVDQNVSLHTVDILGGYYNGDATNPGTNNYLGIGRYIRFQKNKSTFDGWPVP